MSGSRLSRYAANVGGALRASERGSIETGKWADFTVLAANPLAIDPADIRSIRVWGTVLTGAKQPGARSAMV